MTAELAEHFDVVIVGGAVVGSAAAYFLAAEPAFGGSVLVIERDPSYRDCATTRSVASIRHQFSVAENVRLSRFGTEFLRHPEQLAVDGDVPAIGLREAGYLFLATPAGATVLARNHALQRSEGADIAWLDRAALAARFPWLRVDDLAAGTLGLSGEGWLDAHALMHGLRRKAAALGARVLHGDVVALERRGHHIESVRLADGRRIGCGTVVNAAGTAAAALARTAGIELPVESRKRCVFHFRSPARLPQCPLVIDPTGMYFRPEGDGFLCGIAPPPHDDPACTDFEVPPAWFEEALWPLLAARVPGFEAVRLLSAWAGHYDVNTLDHNVILGAHPLADNLLFANGFSGHGVQQAPGVGRALAELVAFGEYRSLDLSAFGWQRVLERRPLRELNVM
jgi:FAD-dependent oxidoreductase domain-containing protein 1